MPLAFNSLSHGEIAFGFFNIETDLLLLDRYFIFASDFCSHISDLAGRSPGEKMEDEWDVYVLDQGQIGSLMGAIHGIDLRGFIGDVYRQFPFPADPNAFSQNPDGYATRTGVTQIIERYQHRSRVPVTVDRSGATIEIGDYLFSLEVFQELLMYVWLGGYPRWKEGRRPDYVIRMKEVIGTACHPLFSGMAPFI